MEESARDLLLDLIVSDIKLARAFVTAARAAHDAGRAEDSAKARLKAEKLYQEASELSDELSESDRLQLSSELQNLSTIIGWFSIQTAEPGDASAPESETSQEGLRKVPQKENWRPS